MPTDLSDNISGSGGTLKGSDDISGSGGTIKDLSDDISGNGGTLKESLNFADSTIIETKLRNIDVKNRELDNLLFAINNSFAISEEGYLYAKESYIQNGLFKNFICESLTVTKNSVIAGNLTINGDLTIMGDLAVSGGAKIKKLDVSKLKVTGNLTANEIEVEHDLTVGHELKTDSLEIDGESIGSFVRRQIQDAREDLATGW